MTNFINFTEDAFVYMIASQYINSNQYLFWYENKKFYRLLSKHFNKNMNLLISDLNELENGIDIIDIVIKSNLLKSKSEVRRAIKNLGIKVNNNTINQENSTITINEFKDNILKLSHGKKNHVLFKIIN